MDNACTPLDESGQDLDIWGDGRATNSTPIPEEWESVNHEGHEEHEGSTAEDAEDAGG